MINTFISPKSLRPPAPHPAGEDVRGWPESRRDSGVLDSFTHPSPRGTGGVGVSVLHALPPGVGPGVQEGSSQ